MRIRLCCYLLLMSCLGSAQADLGKLEYLTEEYPPYNFSDEAGQPSRDDYRTGQISHLSEISSSFSSTP